MQNKWLPSFVVLAIIFSSSLTYGFEVLFPATQVQKDKSSINMSYLQSHKKLTLNVKNRAEIKIADLSYFSDVENSFECSAYNETVSARFLFNPHDNLYYWIKAGSCAFEIELPIISENNKLLSVDKGYLLAAGITLPILPDTIVTPGIALSAGFERQSIELGLQKTVNKTLNQIENKLEVSEIQAAVIISKKTSKIEPYGGVKVFRTYTRIFDRVSLGIIEGIVDNVGVFIGSKIRVYSNESIILESSFDGQMSISAGWNIDF